ncbi:hypothetical protein Y887_12080 [Xanthomonas pisi DSM 18956]|uniref:Uncharacterized protein n=1 Tax=Xanthomonas pisi TaxID=56457 RepID=A0A2S7CW64_9XANT|nr:hypothetical protein Y887_12080 [Xanthomonas pisi DSM 18956]PPU65823.1 hypothetical protein XpiCFBP4643_20020 [Xanthomonas pisi]
MGWQRTAVAVHSSATDAARAWIQACRWQAQRSRPDQPMDSQMAIGRWPRDGDDQRTMLGRELPLLSRLRPCARHLHQTLVPAGAISYF